MTSKWKEWFVLKNWDMGTSGGLVRWSCLLFVIAYGLLIRDGIRYLPCLWGKISDSPSDGSLMVMACFLWGGAGLRCAASALKSSESCLEKLESELRDLKSKLEAQSPSK